MKQKSVRNYLASHLEDNGMGYIEHMIFAIKISWIFLSASILLGIHALLPFILVDCASKRIKKINSLLELDPVQE